MHFIACLILVLGSLWQEVFNILYILYLLFIFIPNLAVAFRRLHDIGKSGWWILIVLIPLIGVIWFLVLMAGESVPDNEYGPNPKKTEEQKNENVPNNDEPNPKKM